MAWWSGGHLGGLQSDGRATLAGQVTAFCKFHPLCVACRHAPAGPCPCNPVL